LRAVVLHWWGTCRFLLKDTSAIGIIHMWVYFYLVTVWSNGKQNIDSCHCRLYWCLWLAVGGITNPHRKLCHPTISPLSV
jgi:hypothetical protein